MGFFLRRFRGLGLGINFYPNTHEGLGLGERERERIHIMYPFLHRKVYGETIWGFTAACAIYFLVPPNIERSELGLPSERPKNWK